jgi:hypothetical protein
MRHNFADKFKTEDEHRSTTFNEMRHDFSKALLKRFHKIKDAIEDIFDLDNTKALLAARLKTIADKNPQNWTAKNLIDMALISCILWNGVDDEE